MDPATLHRTRFESCHPHRGQCGPAALSGASQRPPPSTSFACILDFPWEPAFAGCGLRGKPGPAARGRTHSPGPTPPAMVTLQEEHRTPGQPGPAFTCVSEKGVFSWMLALRPGGQPEAGCQLAPPQLGTSFGGGRTSLC